MATKLKYTQDELIVLIREKDQKAFSYLYENYSQALYGVICAIVSETAEAEDVLQKSFFKIWNSFSSYNSDKGRLYTWMLNIARNQAIDSKRSKHEKIKLKIQTTESNVDYKDKNLHAEENKYDTIGLTTILEELNEEHKSVINLAYFEGYTQEEISRKLNVPLGTIKTRVRQALLRLRELTKKEILS